MSLARLKCLYYIVYVCLYVYVSCIYDIDGPSNLRMQALPAWRVRVPAIDGNVIKVVSTQRTLQGKHRKSARNAAIFVQPSQLMKAEEAQDVAYSFLISLDCRKKKKRREKKKIYSIQIFAIHFCLCCA